MAGYATLTRPTICLLLLEHLLKQRLRPLQSLLREDHRFHLAHRIVNHALVVKTAEHSPIETFPGSITVVQRQIEQRQRRVVDLVGVEGHREPPAAGRFSQSYPRLRKAQSRTESCRTGWFEMAGYARARHRSPPFPDPLGKPTLCACETHRWLRLPREDSQGLHPSHKLRARAYFYASPPPRGE